MPEAQDNRNHAESDLGRGHGWWSDCQAAWRSMPRKFMFLVLLGGWIALFHFWGNAALAYANTPSLFGWWWDVSTRGLGETGWNPLAIFDSEESFVFLAPLVVFGLFWWKRTEFLSLPKRAWWPAIGLLVLALVMHLVGYLVQQARVSLLAFFVGVYALTGLTWGPRWLRASFFPFLLFGFCLPLANQADYVTFPLRLLATSITTTLSHVALGINVLQEGTRIYDSTGAYQYEVAAACSGIRSLSAIQALAIVYGFITFKTAWRRWVMIASGFPLAVAANVFRLTIIIIAAEAFGREAGNRVHDSEWFSLVPYVPAIAGIILLGHWLSEDKRPENAGERIPGQPSRPAAAEPAP
jgi:exosortase